MWTIFEGLLEPRGVEVTETAEARARRLKDEQVAAARRLAVAERAALEHHKKLVEPVLGQEEIHFVGEGDGGTYREPPRTDQDLLRMENSVLRRKGAAMRGKVRFWRWLAGIGVGWIIAGIVRFFW